MLVDAWESIYSNVVLASAFGEWFAVGFIDSEHVFDGFEGGAASKSPVDGPFVHDDGVFLVVFEGHDGDDGVLSHGQVEIVGAFHAGGRDGSLSVVNDVGGGVESSTAVRPIIICKIENLSQNNLS